MTEAKWLACEVPEEMLRFHECAASKRKLRLFDVACCERVEHLFIDARSRSTLACARRFADGRAETGEWHQAASEARSAWEFSMRRAGTARYGAEFDRMTRMMSSGPGLEAEILGFDPAANATAAVLCAVESPYQTGWVSAARLAAHAVSLERGPEAGASERRVQSHLLRDIVGNPFRPVKVTRAWLTTDVLALARGIYDERAFDRMPILADALQDAGCDSEDVLFHCRNAHPDHVRGCWVLDLVLGKT